MTKFIMVYKGEVTPMDEMTEEQGKAVMDAWGHGWGKSVTASSMWARLLAGEPPSAMTGRKEPRQT